MEWNVLAALLLAAAARPVEPDPPAPPPDPAPPGAEAPAELGPFMRPADEPGRTIALEIATRTFTPAAGRGPAVELVGVSHIGERGLYDEIQNLLDRRDVVLYESVMPPGTGGAGGSTDAERIESTRRALEFVATVAALHHERAGRWPEDLEALEAFARDRGPRIAAWLEAAQRDAWGRPVRYRAEAGAPGFVLESLGADGRPGGEGPDADVTVTERTPVEPVLGRSGDNIQAALAGALGLEFQLEAIDYDRLHFRNSDMAMDEIDRAFRAEGMEFAPIESSLAGTSLPGMIGKFFLRLVRVADIFFEGAIADSFKVVLIEMFSDEAFIEQSIRMYGRAFETVLIEQRNQVVVDDLKRIIEGEPEVESVAVLYGAAHMPDLARRLETQLGYEPIGERWITAFEVDLARTAVTPRDLQRLRMMVRRQMEMMK